MTQALHSTIATIIWVILIYMIVVAVFSTQFGRIGDIYGRSRMFNLGFIVFTIASFLCGIMAFIRKFSGSILFSAHEGENPCYY